jgi:hypothetical protein
MHYWDAGFTGCEHHQCNCKEYVMPSISIDDEDFEEILQLAIKIQQEKGPGYEVGTGDKLYNFKKSAELFGGTPLQHLGNHFWKHIAAICSYIKSNGVEQSEPIERRLADAINYICLIYKHVKEEEKKKNDDIPF